MPQKKRVADQVTNSSVMSPWLVLYPPIASVLIRKYKIFTVQISDKLGIYSSKWFFDSENNDLQCGKGVQLACSIGMSQICWLLFTILSADFCWLLLVSKNAVKLMFYNLCTSKKYRSWGLTSSNSPDIKLPKEADMLVLFLQRFYGKKALRTR